MNPAYIHYGINGAWTTVPGVAMDTACTGWKKKTIDLGTATSFQVTFNNGSGSWDNNQGRDYTIGTGTSTVKNGVVTGNAPDPAAKPCRRRPGLARPGRRAKRFSCRGCRR